MKMIRLAATVFARFCISLVFLAGAVNKFLHWSSTQRLMIDTFSDWQTHVGSWPLLQQWLSQLISFTPILLIGITLLEFVGALAVLLGIKEKLGASLLILFLIPTTMIMHQFWFVDGLAREMQLAHFLKNMAILGGLLMITLQPSDKQKNPFSLNL